MKNHITLAKQSHYSVLFNRISIHLWRKSNLLRKPIEKSKKMAKPIKETPILKGKDARKFLDDMSKASTQKVNAKEIQRIRDNFSKLQAIAHH